MAQKILQGRLFAFLQSISQKIQNLKTSSKEYGFLSTAEFLYTAVNKNFERLFVPAQHKVATHFIHFLSNTIIWQCFSPRCRMF